MQILLASHKVDIADDNMALCLGTNQVDFTCQNHQPVRLARLKGFTSIETLLLKTLQCKQVECVF